MKKIRSLLKYHKQELLAPVFFLAGGTLGMLGLIQRVPLVLGILGIIILVSGLFFYCVHYSSEKVYKNYYMESYEIEHDALDGAFFSRGGKHSSQNHYDHHQH